MRKPAVILLVTLIQLALLFPLLAAIAYGQVPVEVKSRIKPITPVTPITKIRVKPATPSPTPVVRH